VENLEKGSDEEIKDLLVVLKELDRHVDSIEEKMKEKSKNNQTMKLMMTMPGIGIITGCSIYAEVGDFNRFASPNALASYAGIIPRQRSSGEKVKMGHITKMGSKILRYSLVEASFRIRDTKKSKSLFSFYKRLSPKCGAKKARVALARKMLVILWYMVKNNTPYIDRTIESTQSEVIS
jgi:transposase